MRPGDYLAVTAIAFGAAIVTVYVVTYFGVPFLTPQPPRNTQTEGQGNAPGQ